MRQIILNIPENKFKAFLEFIRQIPFVKVAEKKKAAASEKRKSFTVMNVVGKNFKFNRSELNER